MIIPPPKLVTSFPVSSNLSIVFAVELRHEFAPHRSATQMDFPSRSMSTALVDPQVRPSGSFAQFSIVWSDWAHCLWVSPSFVLRLWR